MRWLETLYRLCLRCLKSLHPSHPSQIRKNPSKIGNFWGVFCDELRHRIRHIRHIRHKLVTSVTSVTNPWKFRQNREFWRVFLWHLKRFETLETFETKPYCLKCLKSHHPSHPSHPSQIRKNPAKIVNFEGYFCDGCNDLRHLRQSLYMCLMSQVASFVTNPSLRVGLWGNFHNHWH